MRPADVRYKASDTAPALGGAHVDNGLKDRTTMPETTAMTATGCSWVVCTPQRLTRTAAL
jgi:hypothetical protein